MTLPEPDWFDEKFQDFEDPAPPSIPHSREAEEACIGAVFIYPEMYDKLSKIIVADDFYIHRHKWIWDAVESCLSFGKPVDILTVSDTLDGLGQLGEVGGPAYLTSLINQVPSSLNAESYAHIVEAHSIRRKLIGKANKIAQLAYDESKDIESTLTAYKSEVDADGLLPSGHDRSVGADIAGLNLLTKIQAGVPAGVLTHFPHFDHYDAMGALPKGLTFLVGDSSFGKTAWVEQVAEQNAMNGLRSCMFNYEDSDEQMVVRRVSGPAGVNPRKIRSGDLTEEEAEAIADEVRAYQGRFGNPTRLTFHHKERSLREIERGIIKHSPDLVVIDQINQVSDRHSSNKTENMIINATELKNITDEHEVAMLVVHAITAEESRKFFERNANSQKNGSAEKNKMPDINAIAWATQIKYITDVLLFMVPEVNQDLVNTTEYLMNIWILKDRGGSRFCNTHWKYDLVNQWWTDLPGKKQQKAQVPSAMNGGSE